MSVRETYQHDAVSFEDLENDPYPTYKRWRRERPIGYLPDFQSWMVTRWDDCETIGAAGDSVDAFSEGAIRYFGHNILNIDGAPHKQLRASIDASLNPKTVRQYIERVARPVAREYVSRIRERGSVDATTGLLELVSVRVVANVLGLAEQPDETLQRWFIDLNAGLNNFMQDPDVLARSERAKTESADFSRERLAELLKTPDETTFANMLLSNTPDGQPRSFEDLIGTIWVIILGGFQEPGHAAAASLLGVLGDREQYAAVRDDLSLVPAAIHEGLRWIAPFGFAQRRIVKDLEVGGVVIPAGDEVQLILGSANRDETRYENPDTFDLFRPRLPVASFGYGSHFCAGHFLSRELEKVTFEEMFTQLPNLRLDPESAPVITGFGVRGVKHLPVVWDA